MKMEQHIGDAKWDKLITYMQETHWFGMSKNVVDCAIKEYGLTIYTLGGEEEVYVGVNLEPEVRQVMVATWDRKVDNSSFGWNVSFTKIPAVTHTPHPKPHNDQQPRKDPHYQGNPMHM